MMAPSERIVIRGAREHNLKDIDLELPRNSLIVITGLSGSGKSSLAFDTIYAEGQRRYVESLSAYARQFLGLMEKPDVDSIDGLSPAISIDQKTTSRNPRSTVGTVTEIYDYLRLLWARIGHPHCPECGEPIEGQSVEQITDRVMTLDEGTRFMVMAPVVRGRKGEFEKLFEQFRLEGYSRVRVDGELRRVDEEIKLDKKYNHDISVVVDRLVMKGDLRRRLSESIEAAAALAGGVVEVDVLEEGSAGEAKERSVVRERGRRQGGEGRRGAARGGRRPAHLQRALRLPQLRHLDPGARAADLLLQLAARRLRALPRARLPARGRPGAGRARSDAVAFRGRAAALAARALAVLEAPGRGGGRGLRDRSGHALAGALRRGQGDLPLRHRGRASQGHLHEPLRPAALLQRPLRGDRQQPRATLRGDRFGRGPRAGRGLHGRAALPGLQGGEAAAGEPRGQGRGDLDPRVHRDVRAGSAALDPGPRDDRHGAGDRAAPRPRDHRAAGIPRQRRRRLPQPGALGTDPVGRRGAADPAGDADRLEPGRACSTSSTSPRSASTSATTPS